MNLSAMNYHHEKFQSSVDYRHETCVLLCFHFPGRDEGGAWPPEKAWNTVYVQGDHGILTPCFVGLDLVVSLSALVCLGR